MKYLIIVLLCFLLLGCQEDSAKEEYKELANSLINYNWQIEDDEPTVYESATETVVMVDNP